MLEYLDIIFNSAVLVALIAGGIKFYELRKKEKKPFTKALQSRAEVSLILIKYRIRMGSPRILIMKGSNGGRPKPESHFFTSIIAEEFENQLHSIKSTWQNQRIDRAYEAIIHEMLGRDFIVIKTDKMPRSILKDNYEHQDLTGSILSVIHENKDRLIYLSIHVEDIACSESPSFRDDLRQLKNKLRKIYSS